MVPIRKKSWDIIPSVDFRNLNQDFDKENYPVPPIERVLQLVSGSKMFSLLDRLFGYN
jgi:hypothetical protein